MVEKRNRRKKIPGTRRKGTNYWKYIGSCRLSIIAMDCKWRNSLMFISFMQGKGIMGHWLSLWWFKDGGGSNVITRMMMGSILCGIHWLSKSSYRKWKWTKGQVVY